MKNIISKTVFFLFITCLFSNAKAQMSGVYSVPGTHTSIVSVVNNLNSVGVSGPVTVNIATGYTETVVYPGIVLTATGTNTNPIIFQRSGVGPNPKITTYTTGPVYTPISPIQNGIWCLVGSDYITIDGIDLYDPNITNPATMEYGYSLFKASATNGCQYNTIKNCTVTLNRVNDQAGGGTAANGSRGIQIVNCLSGTQTTSLNVTSATGSNSYNKFYSNTIQNCNVGISLIGFGDISPYTLGDWNNDFGGNIITTGNMILNYGNGNDAQGVYCVNQWNVNISYNLINNNNGGGIDCKGRLHGIMSYGSPAANISITNNTVTLKSAVAALNTTVNPIENATNPAVVYSNTIEISNNLITNCNNTSPFGGPNGAYYGIINTGPSSVLSINNNTISNSVSDLNSGNYFSICNTGTAVSNVNINNNVIDGVNLTRPISNPVVYKGIYNYFFAPTCTVNINNNSIKSFSSTATSYSGEWSFIYNGAHTSSVSISYNTLINFNAPVANNVYNIYNLNITPNSTIRNNSINSLIKTGSGYVVYGYYNAGAPSSGTTTIFNNNFSNVTLTSSDFYGILQGTTPNQRFSISTNTISNISGTANGLINGIYAANGTRSDVTSNYIGPINLASGGIYGMYLGVFPADTLSVTSNTIAALTTSVGGSYGIRFDKSKVAYMSKNKIYDLTTYGGGFYSAMGILSVMSAPNGTLNIFNNLIGNLRAPLSNNVAVNGMYLSSGQNNTAFNVSHNSVYLNAVSSGSNFTSYALYHASSSGSVVAQLTLKNNILVNTSASTGTGQAVAFGRSGTALSNYNIASDRNIFYAGNPSSTKLLYSDGTNSVQTITALKTLLSPRESWSGTENVPFATTVGSNFNFLDLNPLLPTQAESNAMPLPGITDDFAGNIRNTVTPDIGAWEGNYTVGNCLGATGGSLAINSFTLCSGSPVSLGVSGNNIGSGIVYQWQVSLSSTGPYSNVSGGIGATTLNYTSSPLPIGVSYYVLNTTCSSASMTAVSNEATVTVNALPSISASTANSLICVGQTSTLTAAGASTYSWSTSSTNSTTVVSPSVTTNYTVIGTDINGCSNSTIITQSVSTCASVSSFSNEQNGIRVFPNPFNEKINIVMWIPLDFQVQIFNSLGSLIYMGKTENGKSEIDLSNQSSGIYFIKVGSFTRKIIKD
jgi:hypothetical protein